MLGAKIGASSLVGNRARGRRSAPAAPRERARPWANESQGRSLAFEVAFVVKFSELLERPITTRDGRKLGHLLDLRIQSGEPVVTEGIYGMRGFLEKIGFRKGRARTFHWDQVVAIDPDRIVIEEQKRSR
jgi:sporulation protein YlmC with PRC-barrel domain